MTDDRRNFFTHHSMKFDLSDERVQELGSLLFMAFSKLMRTPRTVAAFNMTQTLPKTIKVRVAVASRNRFRVEEIIHKSKKPAEDIWNDPRIVGILSSIGNKSVNECINFDMMLELAIKKWFWGGICAVDRKQKKAEEIHPTKVIGRGFKTMPVKCAKLPIFAFYDGEERQIFCTWEIEIPFVLQEDNKTYVAGKSYAIGKVVRIGNKEFKGFGRIDTEAVFRRTND